MTPSLDWRGKSWKGPVRSSRGRSLGTENSRKGQMGGGEEGWVPRALQWQGLRREGGEGEKKECRGVGRMGSGGSGTPK